MFHRYLCSSTVVVRFVLSIPTNSGLRAGITLSVRISKSNKNLRFLIFCCELWVMFPRCPTCLNPIILTYILVMYCGYIVVSFEAVVSGQFVSHIPYMGHGFIGFLTHASLES